MLNSYFSDEPLRGPVQELDFNSDDDDEEEEEEDELVMSKVKKSKQFERPVNIIPTASDESDSSESGEEDGKITMGNMEARSRALDEAAAADAELDAEELRQAALEAEDEEEDGDVDMGDGEEASGEFMLPTAAEKEEEKLRGGPDIQTVQQRMKYCVRVLGNFRKRAEKGRCVS